MNKKVLIIITVFIVIALIGGIVFAVTRNSNNEKNEKENAKVTSAQKNEIKESKTQKNENKIEENNKEEKNMYSTGLHHATIVIKNYGTIKLELNADVAPITVQNFAKLVNEGFYDGLTFHRIIDGFMIQGGDPLGTGFGGSEETIKGEFAKNGVENNISHKRGVISMARSTNKNSASSQFFIVHEDSKFLDGEYAAFGKVIEGIEVVDKICESTKVEDNNGTVLKENQPIIEKITIED